MRLKDIIWRDCLLEVPLYTLREMTAKPNIHEIIPEQFLTNYSRFNVLLQHHLVLNQLLICIIVSVWYLGFEVMLPIYLQIVDTQHKSLLLVFNTDLPPHSRPSPNALSFISLSILFPRLLCLHISNGMERK